MASHTTQVPLDSPFALMFADSAEEILARAERMNVPRKRYSPLSRPTCWAAGYRKELAQFDAAIDSELEDDIASPSSEGGEL